MTKIKFCGITRPGDAMLAAQIGASYAGVIFAESSRRVTPNRAAEIFDASGDVKRVGVFGHRSGAPLDLIRTSRDLALDVVQLHGRFTGPEILQIRADLEAELWAVISVDPQLSDIDDGWEMLADIIDALVLDTSVRGATGGTGIAFDWLRVAGIVRRISAMVPVVLAGGLHDHNVGQAIRTLHPAVVDVSSGIESSPGIKSEPLMRAFADAVASASIV
ncbi:MAG TPA: phosphoribosylanthranilate isomerase [Gemmatimonadaceae bacterium]|nr:phosphoribosylanthranilate isomerase [Gemmatimonadaceae bacterium]